MRAPILLLSLCFCLTATATPTVYLPNGARWAVTAPRADRFVREWSQLLDTAARPTPSLGARSLNNTFLSQTGLGLLSVDELEAQGVDPTKAWTLFERQGATWLEVTVKDVRRLGSAMDGWAASRLLKSREERPTASQEGVVVTYARAKGTRAAAGYIQDHDRAVILLRAAERTTPFEQALAAVEGAAPSRPSVDGPVLLWFDAQASAKDLWIALQPKADALELTGAARALEAGWVTADPARSAWISALTADTASERPLRARYVAGDKAAKQLGTWLSRPAGADVESWLAALAGVSKGPTELFVPALNLGPPTGTYNRMAELLGPAVVLPDRDGLADVIDAGTKAFGLKSVEGLFMKRDGPLPLTVQKTGKSLFAGLGDLSRTRPAPAELTGKPQLVCAKGSPVAALRLDLRTVGKSVDGLGLFAAMKDDTLMGLYGLNAEYTPLLRVLEPLKVLVCQEPNGRATLTGRVELHVAK